MDVDLEPVSPIVFASIENSTARVQTQLERKNKTTKILGR